MNAAAFSFPVQALQTLLQVRFDIQHPIWIPSIISRLHLNVIYHLLDTLQDSADSRGLACRGFGELIMLQVVFSGIAYLGHSRDGLRGVVDVVNERDQGLPNAFHLSREFFVFENLSLKQFMPYLILLCCMFGRHALNTIKQH